MRWDGNDPADVVRAAQRLALGELVAFPTETVYGLGADASNATAVARIFAAKGRPADHPLIVHVAEARDTHHFAASVPPFAAALMQAFWPGPLTLILPRREGVAAAAAGGQASIGLRCPSHPVAQALLRACQATTPAVWGVAGPSANQFGRVSPTTADHVAGEFPDTLAVLDGGACTVGIESTIIDCTRGQPVLLRPGMVSREQIAAVCGGVVRTQAEIATEPLHATGVAPRASGTLDAHYAPRAKVRLMEARALRTALRLLGADAHRIAVYARTPLPQLSPQVVVRAMPDDPGATAQQLFAVLRAFDDADVALIWVETPPATADWEGVSDRLRRAAAS